MSHNGLSRSETLSIPAVREEVASTESLSAARMRRGRALVVSGFAVAVLGVVGYCAACFAGGMHHALGELLLESSTPFVTTLVVIGLGTALWLAGSITYLSGAMDAEESDEQTPRPRR